MAAAERVDRGVVRERGGVSTELPAAKRTYEPAR